MKRSLILLLTFFVACFGQAQSVEVGAVNPAVLCAGASLNLPFTASGSFAAGNVFSAELSSASGSFGSPVTIGSLATTTSGMINATIPAGTASGNGYRIRVVASDPVLTGPDNGSNISINAPPVVNISGNTNLCAGSTATLVASGANTYTWSPTTLPVDAAPGQAAMAVGLRLLKSGYTGPIIRLRRDSDNAEMDFGASGPDLDLAAIRSWLGGASAFCVRLYDQSGNARDEVQASPGTQPQFIDSSVLNGRPALVFNTSQYMRMTDYFSNPFTVVYAARQTGGARGRVLSSVSNNWLLGYWAGLHAQAYFEGWVNLNYNLGADNSIKLTTGSSNGSVSQIYENGSLVNSNSGGVYPPYGLQLNGSGLYGEYSDCEFYDVVAYNTVLSGSARSQVESNIWNYYVTANQFFVSLDAGQSAQYTVTGSTPGCSASTQTVSLSNNTPGDPSVFGNQQWNVYAWNGGTYYNNGSSWNTNYSGYYTAPGVNFNSQDQWDPNTSPSAAPGYQGCAVNTDFFSWAAKRRGFPCGYYRIKLGAHDYYGRVLVNGQQVYYSCCGNGDAIWTGYLNDTSTVEFGITDDYGSCYGSIRFERAPEVSFSYPVATSCNTGGNVSPVIVAAPGAPAGYFVSSPAGLVINSSTGMVDPAASTPGQYTISYIDSLSTCNDHVDTSYTTLSISHAPGDPSVFGQNAWIVYGWNSGNYYDAGTSWNQNYSGYFVDSSLNHNSQNFWPYNGSPSNAAGWQGCPINADYHSWAAKRRGFPCGYYRITLPSNDDYAQVYVNGQLVYYSCCSSGNAWTGYLNDTSTVDFRVTEGSGSSYGSINFTIIPEASIAYPGSSYCNSAVSISPAIAEAPGGTEGYFYALPAGLSIDSTTGIVTPQLSSGGDYRIHYHRIFGSSCGVDTLDATFDMHITAVTGDPSVYGDNVWNVYGWNGGTSYNDGNSWVTNYAGYYVDNVVDINTQSVWPANGSPSNAPGWQGCAMGADNHSYAAKRKGFPCGYYSINIAAHDDEADLWVNGVKVWGHQGCCDSHSDVWRGYLSATDSVMFRVTEGGGGSYGALQFVRVAPATISYPLSPYCNTGGNAPVTFSGVTGGSFSGDDSIVVNAATGSINLNASIAGTHTIYYVVSREGCSNDTVITTMAISPSPSAAISYPHAAYCSTDAPVQVIREGAGGGSYTVAPSGLTLDSNTGQISPSSSAAGTYTVSYTIPETGDCASFTNSTQVTISNPPSASFSYNPSTFCTNLDSATVTQFSGSTGGYFANYDGVSLNAATGTIYPGASTAGGHYIYYYVSTVGCAEVGTYAPVYINQAPVASITYASAQYYIGGGIVPVNQTGTGGGTYSTSPSGLSINAATGALNLNISSAGIYTVSYSLPSGTCPGTAATTTVQILPAASAQISYNGTPFCNSFGIATVTQTGLSGGAYSAQPGGLQLNAGTGDLNVSGSTPGNYTITYFIPAGNGHGEVTATTNVTISASPSATISYESSPFCNSAQHAFVTRAGTGGGTFTAAPAGLVMNGSTGEITPQSSQPGSYTVTYFIPATGGCASFQTNTTLSILPSGTVNTPASQVLCAGTGTAPITFSGGTAGTIYNWSNDNTSIGLGASGTGDIPAFVAVNTGFNTQQATITVTPVHSNGCAGIPKTFYITVNAGPAVSISGGEGEGYCIGQHVTLTASGGTSYQWSTGAATPGIDVSASGVYSVTASNASGCTRTVSQTVSYGTNHMPTLSFTGATGFVNSVMNPASGTPTADYRFEVRYTDADGDLPQSNTIKLLLDYEGNGSFSDGGDRTLYLSEKDPSDLDVTDGKAYFIVVNFLQPSANWHTTAQATDQGGCVASFGPFAGPVVLPRVDISIFANDITFSNPHPEVGTQLTITANIHNNSGRDASNFSVRLVNQNDTGTHYPVQSVSFLSGAGGATQVSWTITTPPVPMWCPMQVFIDNDNVLDESNELDNQAIRPFINGNYQLPGDIGLTAAPSATVILSNDGIAISGTAWYRNTAVQLIDTSCAGATVTVKIVETNQTAVVYSNSLGAYTAYFPAGPATPGTYHVQVTITDYTLDGDTTTQFQVNQRPVCTTADLVSSINLSAGTITPQYPQSNTRYIIVGQSLTGTATETNVGTEPAADNLLALEAPGGTPEPGPYSVGALSAGQTFTQALPAITFSTIGSTYVRSSADAANTVAEICGYTEGNNSSYQGVVVLPNQPDIAPANTIGNYIYANQCQGIPGVSFVVRNLGGQPTGSFNARLTVLRNGVVETVINQTVGNINPLWETSVAFNYTYSGLTGVYTFVLDCDMPDAVSEYNEGNNGSSYQVQVGACNPDLAVWGCGNVTVTPAEPSLPSNITISAQLANTSLVAISAPIDVDFNVGGSHYVSTFNGTLAAGANTTVSVTIPAPAPGNNSLVITVDPSNALSETNETNNSTSAKLCWDLQPTNGSCYGGSFIGGTQIVNTPVSMQTGLYNLGLYKASHAQVRFEVSGPGISGWLNLGTVSANIANTCSCPLGLGLPNPYVFTQTGDYVIRITADPNAQYAECDEGNNQIFVNVHVVFPLPDYFTRSEYIAPSLLNPDLGQPIDIDISYKNGGASTVDSLTVFTQVDNDSLTQVRVPGLVTGQLNTVRMPASWSSNLRGIHVIRAKVDKDAEITEGDELNNEATRAVIVGKAPNLLWQSFSLSSYAPATGATLGIQGIIHNIGFEDCDAVLQILFVDDNGSEVLISQRNISVAEGADYNLQAAWHVTDMHTRIIARIINGLPAEYNTDDNEASANIGAMSLATTFTQSSCGSISDGSATVTINGGKAPYARLWSNGETTETIIVPAGTYTVTVSDADGVVLTDTVTVTAASTACNTITSSLQSNHVCSGSSLAVDYIATGNFSAGNQFVAELSDASGSFANPVAIGSVTSNGSGTISCSIPANTTGGTGYMVRVLSTSPVVTEAGGHSLTVLRPASATISYSGPFCTGSGTAPVALIGDGGGSFSAQPAGLAIDPATGVIDLSETTAGTYTVTYAISSANACQPFSTSTIVVINAASSATISYGGSPFCHNGSGMATITGTGGGTFSSTAGLVIDANTGAIDLAASTSGNFLVHYTIATSGTCALFQAQTTVTIYAKPVADSYADIVTRNGAANGQQQLNGSPAGLTLHWSNDRPGIGLPASGTDIIPAYTAVNNGSSPVVANIGILPVLVGSGIVCYGDSSFFTITVNPFTVSTISYPNSPYCARGNAIPVRTGQAGGVYSAPPGLSLNAGTGAVNLAASAPGSYTATYNYSSYGQAGAATTTIVVAPLPSINSVPNQLVCGGAMTSDIVFTGNGSSYNWTNDNPAIGIPSAGNGTIASFLAVNNGTSNAIANMTATAITGGCTSTPVSFRITVKPQPNVTVPANTVVCAGSASPALNFAGTVPGSAFSWTNNNTTTGIGASGSGSIPSFNAQNNTGINQVATIAVTPAAAGCTGGTQTFTFAVVPAVFSIAYSAGSYCPSGTASVTRNGSTGGSYSVSPSSGLSVDTVSGLLNLNNATAGTYTITYTVGSGGGSCSNTASTQVTINPRPTVNTIGNQVFCPGLTSPIAFAGSGVVSYSWTNNNTAIGLQASGSGAAIPAFTAVNNSVSNANATISVTANGACPGNTVSFRIAIYPRPTMNAVPDQVYCRGVSAGAVSFSSAVPASSFQWSRSNVAIGLSGTAGWGNIPAFTTQNGTSGQIVSQVTVTPYANKCPGAPMQFRYVINNCVAQAGDTGGEPQQARLADLVTVGPNPTQGSVTIWFSGKTNSARTVELLDQYGRSLTRPATFVGTSYTISLVGLTAGTYVVRIVDADTKETVQRKVIKL